MGIGSGFGAAARGLALCSAFALAACGSGDNGGSTIVHPSGGTLKVSLTDAPACGFDNVYITVSKVRVHMDPNADPSGSGWTDIAVDPGLGKIDLLTLTNGVFQTLGQTSLPTGTYQQIRLILAANSGNTFANSVVPTGGAEQALDTPSAQQSGLKINGPFDVPASTLADLVLDFNACKSIVKRGNGTYGLKPVISAVSVTDSGAITGVLSNAAGAAVYAERGGAIVKATIADSTGSFTLAPIEQLSGTDSVDVVIVPTSTNGFVTGVVRDVPVSAGSTTTIASKTSPIVLPSSAYRSVRGTVTPASADATVRALQTIGGRQYEIASTNAPPDTGIYGLFLTQPALPSGTPVFGTYRTLLPIPLSQDFGAAAQFTIQAQSSAGATITRVVDLRNGNLANLDFSF